MRFVHNVGSGCVLSFDDDPWMVYPLTYAHLDILATYLLLMKSTMGYGSGFDQKSSSSLDSRFTKESKIMMPTAMRMAMLATIK